MLGFREKLPKPNEFDVWADYLKAKAAYYKNKREYEE